MVLCVVFMFHQYRKRQESRAVALAADTATQAERSRVSELNELVAIGQSLANALDFKEIEQAPLASSAFVVTPVSALDRDANARRDGRR